MALNAEDLAIIRADGVPLKPGAQYVTVFDNGSVTFTERGMELYRVAMHMYGLDPGRVDAVHTRDDLRQLTLDVLGVRLEMVAAEAEAALRRGEIPVRSRATLAALLYGGLDEFSEEVQHRQRCEAAGPNVMPFPLRRRWPRRAVATEDLTPEEIAEIAAAQMPPGHEYLDAELEGWEPDDE